MIPGRQVFLELVGGPCDGEKHGVTVLPSGRPPRRVEMAIGRSSFEYAREGDHWIGYRYRYVGPMGREKAS